MMLQRLRETQDALKVVVPDGAAGVGVAIGALTLSVLIGLVAPYLIKVTIDQVILAGQEELLLWIGVGGVVLYGLNAWLNWLHRWRFSRLEEHLHRSIRQRLFEKTLTLDLSHHRRLTPGYLLSRVEADTAEVSALLTQVLPGLWQVCFQVGATLLMLIWLAPRLTLMAIVPVPIFLLLAYVFDRRVRPKTRVRLASRSALYGTLSEVFDGIEAVLVYNGQASVSEWLDTRAGDVETIGLSLARDRSMLFPLLDFAISCVLLAVLVFGGQLVLAQSMTIGAMAAYYFYLSRTLAPVRAMPGIVFGWHRAQTALLRTRALLETSATLTEPKAPASLPSTPQSLVLENVHFAYRDPNQSGDEHRALMGISLSVESGDRVAILGPSGAGKSTLGRLIGRLIDPDEGEVRWGDVSLRDLPLALARAQVGYVGQDVFLFDGSLRDNICFGVEAPSEDAIARAIHLSCVDELMTMRGADDGMPVGPRGQQLSGGQKKRVALARALLHQPRVLVIDQLASDLESALNARIFERLANEPGLSILYLGHRLPDGLNSDKVFRLEHGTLERIWSEPRDTV